MKKLLHTIPLLLGIILTSCNLYYDLGVLEDRLDQLEYNKVSSISKQITAINESLELLGNSDAELNDYITALEAEVAQLAAKLAETNTKIDTVKSELSETISTEKANILAELESFKATVNGELDAIKAVLETLKAKDAELDGKIATLQEYVDTELKSTEDWATATFATLEQYNEVVATIATIEGTIEGLNESIAALETRINEKIAKEIETACATLSADLQNAVKEVTEAYTSAIATAKNELTEAYTTALEDAISALETSMKEWVNEQLTGYYTIAELDAKIAVLATSISEGDSALQKEIDALKESLAAQKTEIAEAYTKAIEEAINTNNGVIDEKIATEISAVNEKIGALEERLNSLEERISAVEDAIEQIKALDITFDTTEKACMAGASVYIGYTITGGDSETAIEAFGDGGWSAEVIAESTTAGKIVVTAPSEISKRGKVVVLATSGAGGVAMKTLYFEEGVLSGILDTYEVAWEACTVAITLKTNLAYSIEIPAEAQEWLTIAEPTRATIRTETITLSVAENPEDMPTRSAVVELVGECGDVLQSFEIVQAPNVIVFADAIVKRVCVEKFDTNGAGELSELEASRVTSLGSYFFGDYAAVVKSFDELRYFTRLTSIGYAAFADCHSLKSITIPDSVTSIGEYAFYGCTSLTSITIPEGVTSIGESAFCGCSSLTSITIPDSVTSIGASAFEDCTSLTSITIPDSVTSIGASAFEDCTSLTSITIGDSVTKIGSSAFRDCSSLTNFYGKFASEDGRCLIVDGVLNSFARAGLTEYTIPDSVTSIGEYAFYGCDSLTSITIPDSVISIGSSAFRNCTSLTSITIPDSVTSIGDAAFDFCYSLTSITIPDSVTSIGDAAFDFCYSLTSITIPDSVTSIGGRAFSYCYSLTSITIPDSVTSIGGSAFYECFSLPSITIPDSVTSIGESAFSGCSSLTSVYCKPTTPPSSGGSMFNASGRKIYVPTESVEAYKAAVGWSDYASTIVGYDFNE